ncbi:hypothetical protein PoB_006095300 [Plakobranchus ocellatus]|uniref:Apple domain-containing protein n=1 Tax=Plakobranchus ocellatus TaxID=259542 RepID=A0AAV4CRD4_9GAST|nr:hypothetical protein PoB_006095300 [Plakobranchus ocellatus]
MVFKGHAVALIIYLAALLFFLCKNCSSKATHDFYVTSGVQNYTEGEAICKRLGYDGLGVAKTPEAYHDMMDILSGHLKDPPDGVYIGIRKYLDIGQLIWDDGSAMAEDNPSYYSLVGSGLYGRISTGGKIELGVGLYTRNALCSKYHTKAFIHGRTVHGKQPDVVSSNLSTITVVSFLACVLQCGQNYRCRAAEFNSHSFTCTTLGPGSYTGLTDNPQVSTFIRQGF